jgi:hypothetical protein
MATKVQRGGEVKPDSPNKGSDDDTRRHEYGIPEDVPPKTPGQSDPNNEHAHSDKKGDKQRSGERNASGY